MHVSRVVPRSSSSRGSDPKNKEKLDRDASLAMTEWVQHGLSMTQALLALNRPGYSIALKKFKASINLFPFIL